MADSIVEYVRALEEEVKRGARMAEWFNERLKEQHERISELEKLKQAPQMKRNAHVPKHPDHWRVEYVGGYYKRYEVYDGEMCLSAAETRDKALSEAFLAWMGQQSVGTLIEEIEWTKERLRDLGDELSRRVDACSEELKELR